jgi:protein SCO1/2
VTLAGLRYVLWGLAGAMAMFVVIGLTMQFDPRTGTSPNVVSVPIGGEFALFDNEGRPRTWSDFRGGPVAVFFGFTHCPDICPTTLAELSVLLADLGGRGGDLQVMLVSGDPERDTPEVLDAYLQSFHPRIVALTGPEAEVDRAFTAFKAYRKKVPTDGGDYTVDHSAGVYLYDRDGGFVGTLDMHEDIKVRRQKVERLL